MEYNDTKEALKRQMENRKRNLANWDSGEMSGLVVNNSIAIKLVTSRIDPYLRSPYPMVMSKPELHGVKPSGGGLKAATTCICEKKPTYHVRKEVYKHVKWFDDLKDPKSSEYYTNMYML